MDQRQTRQAVEPKCYSEVEETPARLNKFFLETVVRISISHGGRSEAANRRYRKSRCPYLCLGDRPLSCTTIKSVGAKSSPKARSNRSTDLRGSDATRTRLPRCTTTARPFPVAGRETVTRTQHEVIC
jgi:hypothetical protein